MILQGGMNRLYKSDAPMLKSALEQMQNLQHLALLTNAISEAGERDQDIEDMCGCAEVRSITESCMLWLCSMALLADGKLAMGRKSPSADEPTL